LAGETEPEANYKVSTSRKKQNKALTNKIQNNALYVIQFNSYLFAC
jgi:hypothetical protein